MNKFFIFVLIFIVYTSVYAANDKAFAWQVSSGQNASNSVTVYLMGSIHFADKTFYPLRKEIEDAFAHSTALVVELDINKIDSNEYNQLILQNGVYKDGATIKDFLSDETWLQLQQRLSHLGVSYDNIKSYKPGVLVLTLTAIQVMQMGFDPQLGIDAYFLAKASQAESSKKIIELESLDQQLNLFLNIPNSELLLKESLYSMDEAELQMVEMVHLWKQGDEAAMSKLLFEEAINEYPAFNAIYDDLFYERNRQMATKIEMMLQEQQQKEIYFVVVGSGHLIGEKGIVKLLKEKGYSVKRL